MSPHPPSILLLAVGLVSAAALGYEILLMRLFSIIQWHHFAYMLISLALLGYGASGTFLTIFRGSLLPAFSKTFILSALLFGLSSVVCFLIAQEVPLNVLEILWSVREWGHLVVIYVVLAVPFFFAANCIGLTFQRYRECIGRVYAADLVGAGTGAIGIIALLFFAFPITALGVIGVLGIAAASLGYLATGPQPRWVATAWVLTVAILTTLIQSGGLTTHSGEYKELSQLLRVMGTHRLQQRSSPLGLLTVVRSPEIPLRYAPGLSLTSHAAVPEQLAVFTDGDGMSVINRYDGSPDAVAFLDDLPSALPYHLLSANPRVLVLGAGGGTDVLQALGHHADQVDAVELNPQLAHLVRRVYGDFAGHLYDDPRVHLHFADARGFVSASHSRYALIQLALLDGFNAGGAGLHALNENYLYTTEAIREYLSLLQPGGFVAITRWVRLPPRDGIKLFATAIAALEDLGITDPGRRLAWIRNWQVSTLLIKNGEFASEDIDRIRRFCAERSFDIAHVAGITREETNVYNVVSRPYFAEATTALLGPQREQFLRSYKFQVEPATDDRPYFFHFFRWPLLQEAWSLKGAGGLSLLDMGYPVLIATLIQALVLSTLLILVPLRNLGDSRDHDPDSRRRLHTGIYFSCIGLAFMFTEIIYLQKFTLYLAHPLYAIPVVLAGFLLFAGMGSRWAARISRRSARGRVILAAAALLLLSTLYLVLIPPWLHGTMHFPTAAKITLVLTCIAPIAICMGFMFPLGMARLTYGGEALLPWAFGLNGCSSVVAAILGALLSIHFGQTAVLLLAMVLYGVAARFVP